MNLEAPGITVEYEVNFTTGRRGRTRMRLGPKPSPAQAGRQPRVTRLMALAIRYDQLVRTGDVESAAALAKAGCVTRARISQVLALTLLAPEIQEELLFLPLVQLGRDVVTERHLRPIVAEPAWASQRRHWEALIRASRGKQGGIVGIVE